MNRLSENAKNLALLGIFSAMIILLTFTPLGYIPLGFVSVTTVHIPVIIGAIVLGTRPGAVLGGVMGMCSLLRAALMPTSPLDALFLNPLISIVPRILLGFVASVVFLFVLKLFKNKTLGLAIATGTSAAAASLTNTIAVLGLLSLIYSQELNIQSDNPISFVIGSIISINGLIEILVAVALSIPVIIAFSKFAKSKT